MTLLKKIKLLGMHYDEFDFTKSSSTREEGQISRHTKRAQNSHPLYSPNKNIIGWEHEYINRKENCAKRTTKRKKKEKGYVSI